MKTCRIQLLRMFCRPKAHPNCRLKIQIAVEMDSFNQCRRPCCHFHQSVFIRKTMLLVVRVGMESLTQCRRPCFHPHQSLFIRKMLVCSLKMLDGQIAP